MESLSEIVSTLPKLLQDLYDLEPILEDTFFDDGCLYFLSEYHNIVQWLKVTS